MMNLWHDEMGGVLSIELVLIATIVGLGAITGLTSLRDGVVTELADVGGAIAYLNQSYQIGGATSHCSWTGATQHQDQFDFCDQLGVGNEGNSRCLIVCDEAGVKINEGPS